MKIFYRISDGGYAKQKLGYATKIACLRNFIKVFHNQNDQMWILLDACGVETENSIRKLVAEYKEYPLILVNIQAGSSAKSFRVAFTMALNLSDTEIVLFQEDDYIYRPGSRTAYLEGLSRSDYVTLYCHPDKFIPAINGGNPEVDNSGSTISLVSKTDNAFWMTCNSTTMTFATKVKTLKEDKDVWLKHTDGTYPQDYLAFLELREKGRTLVQPIPSYSTHAELGWLSPLIGTGLSSWENLLEKN